MSANRRSLSPSYDPSEEAGGPRPEEDWPAHFSHPPVEFAPPPVEFAPPPVQFAGHHHVGSVEFAPPPIQYAEPPVEFAPPPIQYAEPHRAASMSMSEYIKQKKYLEALLLELNEEDDRLNQDMTDNHNVFADLDKSDSRYHDINAYMRQNRNFHDAMLHQLLDVQTAIGDIEAALDKNLRKIERLKRKTACYS